MEVSLKRPRVKKTYPVKNCEYCQKPFQSKYRFCCPTCRNRHTAKLKNRKALTKTGQCFYCNDRITVNLRTPRAWIVCPECKKKTGCKLCSGEPCPYGQCMMPSLKKPLWFFTVLNKMYGFDLSALKTPRVFEEYQRVLTLIVEDFWSGVLYLPNYYYRMPLLRIQKRLLSIPQKMFLAQLDLNKRITEKTGEHITWDNRKVFLSNGDQFEYLKLLDSKKLQYQVKSLQFTYWDSNLMCQRIATPDIFLPAINTITEIRTKQTYEPITMKFRIDKYKSLGYNYNIIVDRVKQNI